MNNTVAQGTLANYPLILGMTQNAINWQFEIMYGTVLDNQPAPPADANLKADRKQTLIDQVVKLGYIPKPNIFHPDKPLPGDGITAWIGSPRIDMSHSDDARKTLRFVLPLLAGWMDVTMGNDSGRILFTDWEVSWECGIGRSNIEDIEKSAIHPDAAAKITEKIDAEVKKQKESNPAFDSSFFQTSALFCLFEETQIANAFKINVSPQKNLNADPKVDLAAAAADPECPLVFAKTAAGDYDGFIAKNPMDKEVAETYIQTFKDNIILYYTGTEAGKIKKPFMLGYTITQTKGTSPGTALLNPKTFHLRTFPHSDPKKATLNFCMLDHRYSDERVQQIADNIVSGILSESLLDTTHASSGTGGIVGIGRDAFESAIIDPIVQLFKLPTPSALHNGSVPLSTTTVLLGHELNKSSYQNSFKFKDDLTDLTLYWGTWNTSGSNTVICEWTSSLSDALAKGETLSKDAKRNLHINITANEHLTTETKSTIKGAGGAVGGSGHWDDGGSSWADIDYGAKLVLEADTDGKWAYVPSVDKQEIILPTKNADDKYEWKSDHHYKGWGSLMQWIGSLVNDGFDANIRTNFAKLAVPEDWLNQIKDSLKTSASHIVLPAGDVFAYSHLDTDASGNVYSHVEYKTIQGGVKVPS